jgi:hypothetical protein
MLLKLPAIGLILPAAVLTIGCGKTGGDVEQPPQKEAGLKLKGANVDRDLALQALSGRQARPESLLGEIAAANPAEDVIVPAGTAIRVKADEQISSRTHRAGDQFEGRLIEPLYAGDNLVAPAGAPVKGVVSEAAPFSVRLTAMVLKEGRHVKVETRAVPATGEELRFTVSAPLVVKLKLHG